MDRDRYRVLGLVNDDNAGECFHRTAEVDAVLAAHGLVKRLHRTTLIWQLALYERPAA